MKPRNPSNKPNTPQATPLKTRRTFLKTTTVLGLTLALPSPILRSNEPRPLLKKIPATNETIPAIGMGTWITFNVGANIRARNARTQVLETFFKLGGRLVDSSPMYGSAEEVIGYALARLASQGLPQAALFSATKVWTPFTDRGKQQIQTAHKLWGLKRFDLYQIHNLLAWPEHLKTLLRRKKDGTIRYIGITTSHGRRHSELEQIIKHEPIDFVQLTYNILDRDVEKRLLPAAQEKGVAVIANRPFQGGQLFDQFARKPLPDFAQEIDCRNWAQFFLKFIVSHPAITCAIPATSQTAHMIENMGALHGRLPDRKMRARMTDAIREL